MAAKSKWTVLASVAGVFILTSFANAQLQLYDNFSSKHLDASKWVGEPASIVGGSDKDRRETTVELSGAGAARHLHIAQTSYADVTDNAGANGSGFGLGFAEPSNVTAVSFTLAVNQEASVGCASSASFGDAGSLEITSTLAAHKTDKPATLWPVSASRDFRRTPGPAST